MMAEQTIPQTSGELQRINWSACFPFVQLFRTFRLAVHPSKLALLLAAVLLTAIWGRLLDGLWSTRSQPLAGELNYAWQKSDLAAWRAREIAAWPQVFHEACDPLKVRLPEGQPRLLDDPAAEFDSVLDDIRAAGKIEVETLRSRLRNDTQKSEQAKAQEIAQAAQKYIEAIAKIEAVAPRGVFRSFVDFEHLVGRQAASAAIGLAFTTGFTDVLNRELPPTAGGFQSFGVLACLVLALRGLQWLVCQHFWFAVLWGLPVLAIWALFGGAVCRMAALNVARDERPAPRAALAFAGRKLLSFFAAPLMPIGLVLAPGIVLAVGGLLMSIPGIGEIAGGLLMGLPLAAGLLMAAVAIGGLAGAPLMWPTIAVEGQDGFDAISRGYSYVFAKPWRAAFYAAVLTVYGAIVYLLVRFFVLLAMKSARLFLGAGMSFLDRPATGSAEASKIDVLWPAPTWGQLLGERVSFGAQNWESGGAFLIGLWLSILVALLCAFAASFFLSGSTIIYYLLRREVDATDIEEVYLESEEEEEAMGLPAAAGEPGGQPAAPSGGQQTAAGSPSAPGPAEAPSDSSAPGDNNIDAE